MQSIKDVIDRGSSENMLLYTSSRENESLNEDMIDSMLNQVEKYKNEDKDVTVVENLTEVVDGQKVSKHKRVTLHARKGKKPVVKRNIHMVKRGKVAHRPVKKTVRKAQKQKTNKAAKKRKK